MALVNLNVEKIIEDSKRLHKTVMPYLDSYYNILSDLGMEDVELIWGKQLDNTKRYNKAISGNCYLELINKEEYPYAILIKYYKEESEKMLEAIREYLSKNKKVSKMYIVQPLKYMSYDKDTNKLRFQYIIRFE